jgi:hypothetical protein
MEGLLKRLGQDIIDANEGAQRLFFEIMTQIP